MVTHLYHSFITIKIIELHVFTVIICMVIHIIAFLKDERLDVVSMKYIQFPIIKMSGAAIIEEHLGV